MFNVALMFFISKSVETIALALPSIQFNVLHIQQKPIKTSKVASLNIMYKVFIYYVGDATASTMNTKNLDISMLNIILSTTKLIKHRCDAKLFSKHALRNAFIYEYCEHVFFFHPKIYLLWLIASQ
jgi:hypothetical protein